MSLFTFEEICKDCYYATWHICGCCYQKPKFCHCMMSAEPLVDHNRGICSQKYKIEPEEKNV